MPCRRNRKLWLAIGRYSVKKQLSCLPGLSSIYYRKYDSLFLTRKQAAIDANGLVFEGLTQTSPDCLTVQIFKGDYDEKMFISATPFSHRHIGRIR